MTSRPTNREIKLARALVHPEKATRDETLEGLQQYLQGLTTYEELEMLKLWKALYYCYWLADKVPIQTELAERYSRLIHYLKTPELILGYCRTFYRIVLREWSLLDQYRVNKFYLLLRLFLREVFTYYFKSNSQTKKSKKSSKRDWSDLTHFHTVLHEEILSKVPNGVRFHICDIYLPELARVTNGELSTEQFELAIRPFFDAIIDTSKEAAFQERVYKTIFLKFLHEYSSEAQQIQSQEQMETELEQEEEETETAKKDKHPYFSQVQTKVLQKRIFDLASSEQTNDRFRKKLYDLHKTYAAQTGVPFITAVGGNGIGSSTGNQDLVIESSHTVSVGHKRKHTTEPETVESNDNNSQAAAEKKESKKVKKQKKSSSEEEPPVVPPPATTTTQTKTTTTTTATATTTETVTTKSSKKTVAAAPTQAMPETDPKKKEKKVKLVEEAPKTASKPVQATTTTTTSSSSSSSPSTSSNNPLFIPSPKFSGAKPGYFFKKGKEGTGYYVDSPPTKVTISPLKSALKKTSSITMMNGKSKAKK